MVFLAVYWGVILSEKKVLELNNQVLRDKGLSEEEIKEENDESEEIFLNWENNNEGVKINDILISDSGYEVNYEGIIEEEQKKHNIDKSTKRTLIGIKIGMLCAKYNLITPMITEEIVKPDIKRILKSYLDEHKVGDLIPTVCLWLDSNK